MKNVAEKIDHALLVCDSLKHELERRSCRNLVLACGQSFADRPDGSGSFELVSGKGSAFTFSSAEACFSFAPGAAMIFGSGAAVTRDGVTLAPPPSAPEFEAEPVPAPAPADPGAVPLPAPAPAPAPISTPEPEPGDQASFVGSKLITRVEVETQGQLRVYWEVLVGGARYLLGHSDGGDRVTVGMLRDGGGGLKSVAPLFGDEMNGTIEYLEKESNDRLIKFMLSKDPGAEMDAIDEQYKKALPQLKSGLLSASFEIPRAISLKAKCKAQDKMRDLLRLPAEMLAPSVCPDARLEIYFKHSKHTYIIGPKIADDYPVVRVLTGAYNAFHNDPSALDMAVELGGVMFVYVDRYSTR